MQNINELKDEIRDQIRELFIDAICYGYETSYDNLSEEDKEALRTWADSAADVRNYLDDMSNYIDMRIEIDKMEEKIKNIKSKLEIDETQEGYIKFASPSQLKAILTTPKKPAINTKKQIEEAIIPKDLTIKWNDTIINDIPKDIKNYKEVQ